MVLRLRVVHGGDGGADELGAPHAPRRSDPRHPVALLHRKARRYAAGAVPVRSSSSELLRLQPAAGGKLTVGHRRGPRLVARDGLLPLKYPGYVGTLI